MIEAVIFDLDGTLVQTERLKAYAFARAALSLSVKPLKESEVVETYKDVRGLSGITVSDLLMRQFNLAEGAAARMEEFEVESAAEVLLHLRQQFFHQMIADPLVVRNNARTYTMALLRRVGRFRFKRGLASSANRTAVEPLLRLLGIADSFDHVVTGDDVKLGKPNPEIFIKTANRLKTHPTNCLVIEDSVPGIRAALDAGMHVVGVPNEFTREAVIAAQLLPAEQLALDLRTLPEIIDRVLTGPEPAGVLV